ncbi:hypothetical protein F8358_16235, partial [Salmonella enterica]|nr:hypothetical protein [Salmonella enterica]
EMILYDGGWYYVLARYHDSFILSKSFTKNNNRFIIFRPEDGHSYEMTPELPMAEIRERTERLYL